MVVYQIHQKKEDMIVENLRTDEVAAGWHFESV